MHRAARLIVATQQHGVPNRKRESTVDPSESKKVSATETGIPENLAFAPASSGATDEMLVRQAANGDRLAFEQLVLRYQDRVFNMLVRMCGSPEVAEDLAQETFLRSWRALSHFRQGARFYTWLYRIAMNTGFSDRRRELRRRAHERVSLDAPRADDERGEPPLPPDRQRDADPARQADVEQTRQRVLDGLNQLSEEYRQILVLRDIDGLDYDAIAEVLALSRSAVKSRLHRARQELAHILRDLKPEATP